MQSHRFNIASALFASFVAALVMAATSSFLFHKCLLFSMGTNAHFQGLSALLVGGVLHLLVAFGYGLFYARFIYPFLHKLPGFLAGALYSLLPFCLAMLFTNPFLQISSESCVQTPLPKAKKMVSPKSKKTITAISSSANRSFPCCSLPGGCCVPCGPCNPEHPALYGCCLPCGTCEPFCSPPQSENPCNPCSQCGPCGPLDFCGPCLSSLQPESANLKFCAIASLDSPPPCSSSAASESSCSPCATVPFSSTLPPTQESNTPPQEKTPSHKSIPPTSPSSPLICAPCSTFDPPSSTETISPTSPSSAPSKTEKSFTKPHISSIKSGQTWVTPFLLHLLYGVILGALYRPKKTPPSSRDRSLAEMDKTR